jgi:L-alanine-DL-glutamate epimerase-like enolase superfamily enzyme
VTAKIERVTVTTFRSVSKSFVDSCGHRHPGPARETTEALLTVTDSDGAVGYCLAQPDHLRQPVLDGHIRPVLAGQDSLRTGRLWQALARRQRGAHGGLTDRAIGYVDQALWDLLGRRLGVPVWKLLGGARDRLPAYASTMCGDEIPGGLATPGDYAAFAVRLTERGYRAIKLHTWMPPVSFAPDVSADIAACSAVRSAVGPDVALMLDANHWYSRMDALRLGLALDELGFTWYEEPMTEASVQSYRWLAGQIQTPLLGPEIAWGSYHARAEWAATGACDILRAGVDDVGGITPTVKAIHLAEAFNMDCEIHGTGSGNLAVLGATTSGRWYERGLLHPMSDYDEPPPHLRSRIDSMDADGFVTLPEAPGLGDDLDHDYIHDHACASW